MPLIFFDISLLLNILGFGQSLFLSITLWRSRKNKLENVYLIILLLAISIIILNSIFQLSYYTDAMSFYENFSNSFLLLLGPSIYLFVRFRIGGSSHKKSVWLHYLPFILYFIANLSRDLLFDTSAEFFGSLDTFFYLFFNFQYLAYLSLSIRKIKGQRPLPDSLKWINVAIWLIFIPWVIQLGFALAENLFDAFIHDIFTLNLTLLFGICAVFLSQAHNSGSIGFSKKDKYEDSKLSPDVLGQNLQEIRSVIEAEQLYLDKDMSLNKVAEKTALSSRIISLTINQSTQESFVDFINGYRVEAFKELVQKEGSDNYTMVALAEDCGFKSSSAFYAAFKKHTGLTPRQYKKTLAENH